MKNKTYLITLLITVLSCGLVNWFLALGLPDKVATHFNMDGKPDDFMTLGNYQIFISLFTILFPFFMCFMIGVLPGLIPTFANIPNRDFWFSPAQKQTTLNYLFGMGSKMGILMALFFVGMNLVTVLANKNVPQQLPMVPFFILLGLFLLSVLIWVILLTLKFKRIDASTV